MNSFNASILASDKVFYEGLCESLRFPGIDGFYGVLAHHRNMITAIVPGTLTFRVPGGVDQVAAISAGMIRVEDNHVLILADTIERPEEIDANRARRDAEEAQEIILQKQSIQSYYTAQARMARALNRLKVRSQYFADGM